MKATIEIQKGSRIDPSHRRESKPYKKYTVTPLGTETPALVIHLYNTPMTTYCCIWGNQYLQGAASAFSRGYGYNREAKAFTIALANMGIILDRELDCNSNQIEALHAIGEAVWPSVKGHFQFAVKEKISDIAADDTVTIEHLRIAKSIAITRGTK